MSLPVWNPYNKVVQSPIDGRINHEATNVARQRLGLVVPWNPLIGEMEMGYPPVHYVLPGCGIQAGIWKNVETERQFRVFASAENSRGRIVVIYRDLNEDNNYVMDAEAFLQLFREVHS